MTEEQRQNYRKKKNTVRMRKVRESQNNETKEEMRRRDNIQKRLRREAHSSHLYDDHSSTTDIAFINSYIPPDEIEGNLFNVLSN